MIEKNTDVEDSSGKVTKDLSADHMTEPGWRPFLVASAIAVVVWAMYLFAMLKANFDWQTRGQFGDMFGALNALFSGIAFAALVYTMVLQRAELRLQRKELEETRKEIRGQKLQLEAQTSTFILQSFESTFFHLVDLHHKIVDGTDIRLSGEVRWQGRDCFARIFDVFKNRCFQNLHRHTGIPDAELANLGKQDPIDFMMSKLEGQHSKIILPIWDAVYEEHRSDLPHYFRNLYHIVKLVDSQPLFTDEQKQRYVSILRAQLSSGELAVLFQNGLSKRGAKFKPLMEKYSLLKNLDEVQIVPTSSRQEYSSAAFGGAKSKIVFE